jgi:uncharacterized protein YeaC (DUF1315 family)
VFELVLHHRYDDPRPHDLSGNGNYGYGAPHRGPGSRPGRKAALFDGSADRIFVTPSHTLTRPGDIRADLTVKLDAFGHRRTLIEGYLSFAVGVEGDGALGGSVYRAQQWTGVQTGPGLVPLDTWITVTFVYTKDGAMMLSMNGETVAESYQELGEAAGLAWPFGLNIGAWPDGDQRLWQGCIEEVMLWRSMPEPRTLQAHLRPVDAQPCCQVQHVFQAVAVGPG